MIGLSIDHTFGIVFHELYQLAKCFRSTYGSYKSAQQFKEIKPMEDQDTLIQEQIILTTECVRNMYQ